MKRNARTYMKPKNLITEIVKIRNLNYQISEYKFLIEAPVPRINLVDDIGRKLGTIIRDIPDANLKRVIEDLNASGVMGRAEMKIQTLKSQISGLPDTQLRVVVQALLNQDVPLFNKLVAETVAQTYGLSLNDFDMLLRDYIQQNPNTNPNVNAGLRDQISGFLNDLGLNSNTLGGTEVYNSLFSHLYKSKRAITKEILSKTQIDKLINAVNQKGGKSYVLDVARAINKGIGDLETDIDNLVEEYLDKIVQTLSDEDADKLTQAYALQIARKLTQLHAKGREITAQELSKLDLPDDIRRLITSSEVDTFAIFQQLWKSDKGMRAAFGNKYKQDSYVNFFDFEGENRLSKFFGEKFGKLFKLRLNENLKAYLISGQWATLQNIYRDAIRMQGISNPKQISKYLFVFFLKSAAGALIGKAIISALSTLLYVTTIKDKVNKILGYDYFDTEKYNEKFFFSDMALGGIISSLLIDFFDSSSDTKWMAPFWGSLEKAPLNIFLGTLLGKGVSTQLVSSPRQLIDKFIDWFIKDNNLDPRVIENVEDTVNQTGRGEFVIPNDLKQTLSGDLQFLQDKVYFQKSRKLYAIRYQKDREGSTNDVELVKPGEEWGYMAGSSSDPTKKFRSFSDETYRKAIIDHFKKGETTQTSTNKTLTESAQVKKLSEQLLVPDKEGETNFQERINQIRERANQVKSSQEVQQIKQKLKDIWGEIEKSTIGATEKARLWNEKNSVEKQLSTKNATNSPEQIRNDISSDFKPCTGFNQLGCKSESIKKVQKCLSLPESGNFDKTLYNVLGQYGWQNGFNDSDTTRVCDLINRKKEENTKLELEKKEREEFYKKFPKTTKGSEILDLS
jgi:hypothetical protein